MDYDSIIKEQMEELDLAELEQIGYKTVLEVYQTAYDRMYK